MFYVYTRVAVAFFRRNLQSFLSLKTKTNSPTGKFGIITSNLQIDPPSLFLGLLVKNMIHDKYVFHKRNYINKVARGPYRANIAGAKTMI